MRGTKFGHFLDSNVVLYLLSADNHKADQAEHLLASGPVISVQVLNEVAHVCRRKLQMTWDDITRFLTLVRGFCKVCTPYRNHSRPRQDNCRALPAIVL